MGQFLTGFASRIFIVALPTIAAALDADILGISWALIAYQLAGISLSVVFGRVGDVYGRYAIYGLGFAILAATSLLCGLAANVLLLVLFRAFQGVGAAMISSATRVLAMDAMPEGSEGKANGLMTMSYHVGFLIGPPLGGLVIDWLGWRWVFFLLVPLGITGVVLTAMRARRVQVVTRGDRPPIDYVGAALLVAITVALTLLLDRKGAALVGAGRSSAVALVLVGAVVGFVVQEWRASDPIVNFALFRIRMFTASVVSLLVLGTANSVLGFLLPFYMQSVLGLSPSFMGLVFLGAPVATIVCASLSGVLTDRLGPRPPTSIGIVLTLGAFVVGFLLRVDSSWLLPALAMIFTGLGTGFFNTANQAALVGSVPEGIPRLCHRDGPDGLRRGIAAGDLAGGPAHDHGLPPLYGDGRPRADAGRSGRLRRGDQRDVPGVRRPGGAGARCLAHARPLTDRGSTAPGLRGGTTIASGAAVDRERPGAGLGPPIDSATACSCVTHFSHLQFICTGGRST